MTSFYDQDLAYVHHAGFGDFARLAGEQILAILSQHGVQAGLVVDLGCGSGIWAARLGQEGYEVMGIDVSPAMVTLARCHAPDGQIEQSSVYDFPLPKCQAITALGEVLGYGISGHPTDSDLKEFFSRAAVCLPRGGLLIFDVIVHEANKRLDATGWQKGKDWAVLVETKENPQSNQLLRNITVFREVNGYYRRSEESHPVRVFSTEQLRQLLRETGFEVSDSDRYGNYQLASRRRAFIAVRGK